jgi:hypothetical protein
VKTSRGRAPCLYEVAFVQELVKGESVLVKHSLNRRRLLEAVYPPKHGAKSLTSFPCKLEMFSHCLFASTTYAQKLRPSE